MPVPVPGVVLDQRQQHLKPQHHLKKQISLVSDLENCVSVNCNCRCRKVALVAILLIAAGTALFCNISLVVKLGKSPQSYPDQYEFDDVPVPVDQQGQMNMNMPPEQEQEQRNDLALWNGMNENDNDDDPLSDDDSNEEQEQKQKQPPEIRAVKTPPISALQKPLKKKKKTKRKRKQKIKVGPPPSPVSVRPVKPLPESLAANATVSACLLIKDDNEILSEWIAYHYHTINLRHLIVAVDPLSSESPTAILENWRLTTDLEIREWSDVHYMPTEFIKNGKAPPEYMATESDFKNATMSADSLLEISNHRYRQRVFLASCMKAVRASGNSWVMHIDTDEYIVPSKLLRQLRPNYITISPMEEPGSVLQLIQQVVEKTAEAVNYPCISMLRVLFGSVESTVEEQQDGVPAQFNATMFESLRWRYHALAHDAEMHGNPKVLMDVRAIPERYFDEAVVYSIHRPVRDYCPKHSDLAFSKFRKQPVAVNHYLGSWDRYSGRNDKRRSRAVYDAKAAVNRGKDDGLRPWLRGFVDVMGATTASKLLGGAYLAATEIQDGVAASATRTE